MLTRLFPGRRVALVTTDQTARGELRRRDFYIGVIVIVLAILAHAQSQRYSVSRTHHGSRAVFQRVDHWRGTADVWVWGSEQPQPGWVQIAGR